MPARKVKEHGREKKQAGSHTEGLPLFFSCNANRKKSETGQAAETI